MVLALKTAEVNDQLKLFAILCSNRDLIYWNHNGQYQFCSIEPIEQFAYLGHTYLLGPVSPMSPTLGLRKWNQNGSIRCWGPSMALAPDRYHFLFIPVCQSALRRGPNGRRQRNRLLRVARHWLGRPRICFCSRVSSFSIASSLRAQAWL